MNVTINTLDAAGPTLAKLVESVTNRRPLHAAMGKRGEVELRAHFLDRNQEPNKKGWPSQNFWERIRSATALSQVDASGATVSISDPAINLKVYGGTVKPKEGKYLALPAIAEAYGRSARTFSNLEPMIRWRDGQRRAVALVERRASLLRSRKDGSATEKKGSEIGGRVFYWLVESVRARRDPKALPETAKFAAALLDETRNFLAESSR